MGKDTYASILTEVREVVKQLLRLRKRAISARDKVGKARDQAKITAIRKQMGLK